MDKGLVQSLFIARREEEIKSIIECNEFSKRYRVVLTEKDVNELLERRKENLVEEERVEFKGGILPKIIYEFCDSPYIYQQNYVETLEGLQTAFYMFKNECLDELSDDELLSLMKKYFNEECEGSLEYLEGTFLDIYCRNIRKGLGIRSGDELEAYSRKIKEDAIIFGEDESYE